MPTSAYHVTPIVVLSKVSNPDNIKYMLLICFEFNKAPQAKVYSMGLIFYRKKKKKLEQATAMIIKYMPHS